MNKSISGTEIMDTALNVLKAHGPFEDYYSTTFIKNTIDKKIIARAWKKLENDGFAYSIETKTSDNSTSIRFYITLEGIMELENCPIFFKGKPYKWRGFKGKLKFWWNFVSVLAIVINSIIILIFSYLTYIKS